MVNGILQNKKKAIEFLHFYSVILYKRMFDIEWTIRMSFLNKYINAILLNFKIEYTQTFASVICWKYPGHVQMMGETVFI